MTGWQLDPGAVWAVLRDVENQATSADGLAGALTPEDMTRAVSYVSWGSEYTQVVQQAVDRLLVRVADGVGAIGTRVVAGVVGVGAAAEAYRQGQEDMSEQERAMMASATSGDFSWFEAHGYLEAQ